MQPVCTAHKVGGPGGATGLLIFFSSALTPSCKGLLASLLLKKFLAVLVLFATLFFLLLKESGDKEDFFFKATFRRILSIPLHRRAPSSHTPHTHLAQRKSVVPL